MNNHPAPPRPTIAVLYRTAGQLPSTPEHPMGHDWLPRVDKAGAAYDGGKWEGHEWVFLDSARYAEGLAERANRDSRAAWRMDIRQSRGADIRACYGATTVSDFMDLMEISCGRRGMAAFLQSLMVHVGDERLSDRVALAG